MRISDWSSDVCSSDLLAPEIDLLGETLIIDDDEKVEVGAVALGGVRLIDPAAARIAAIEDDLVDPTLLLPAHRAKRQRVLEFLEDDLLHALKFALLVGGKMVEIGFHRWRHPVGAAAAWQGGSGVTAARIATTCGSFCRSTGR